jgi:integrase/recombinase XerD
MRKSISVGGEMGKTKVNWYTKPKKVFKKDIMLDRFKRYLKGLGLREETVKLYLGRASAFLDYAKTDEPSIQVAEDYRSLLIDKGLSNGHINNTCFGIKKLYAMNGVEWDFVFLKPNDGVPYYFDEKDVSAIFSVCTNIKHSAMLQTLFYGCLRSSELCKLDDTDLNLEAKTIRLRETKGGRDDIIYISEECAETLRLYLKIRPQVQILGRTPVFYTDNLNLWTSGDVHRMFLYYKKKAGIKKPGAVHVFSRHTTATLMIAKSCDCRIVKEILRHKEHIPKL